MRHPSRRGLSDGEVPEAITAVHLNRRSCRYVREEYMQKKSLSNVDSANCRRVLGPCSTQAQIPALAVSRCAHGRKLPNKRRQISQQCECLAFPQRSRRHKNCLHERSRLAETRACKISTKHLPAACRSKGEASSSAHAAECPEIARRAMAEPPGTHKPSK